MGMVQLGHLAQHGSEVCGTMGACGTSEDKDVPDSLLVSTEFHGFTFQIQALIFHFKN